MSTQLEIHVLSCRWVCALVQEELMILARLFESRGDIRRDLAMGMTDKRLTQERIRYLADHDPSVVV